MKIIAKQVADVYLVDLETEDNKGFIAEFDRGVRFRPFNLHSILARGYWIPAEPNEELLRKILELPEK